MPTVDLRHGDCLDVLRTLPDESVHAVVTDPPYGLANTDSAHVVETLSRWFAGERDYLPAGAGFMGKAWDAFVPPPAVWDECFRVLKPGGHLLCFAGTRTVDLMGLSIRLAGFDLRDTITWLYGSGFPKSLDVGKAIDKQRDDRPAIRVVCRWLRSRVEGHQTETVRTLATRFGFHPRMVEHWAARDTDSQPTLPTLTQWDQLRAALEFSDEMDAEVLRLNLRKGEPGEAWADRPVTGVVEEWTDRTAYAVTSRDGLRRDAPVTAEAQQWHGWGTALKPASEPIVVARKPLAGTVAANVLAHGTGALNIDAARVRAMVAVDAPAGFGKGMAMGGNGSPLGRWPANVVLDGDAADALDEQSGALSVNAPARYTRAKSDARQDRSSYTVDREGGDERPGYSDTGGASRFFPVFRYQAKAPARERPSYEKDGAGSGRVTTDTASKVAHPTVKPLDLMRWLVRLVTPPGGTVLEPFAGSGTTVEAALREGMNVIAVEREADYLPLIRQRIDRVRTPDVEVPPAPVDEVSAPPVEGPGDALW